MFTLSLWHSKEVYSKWRGEGEGRGVSFPWFGERGSTIYEFVDFKISHRFLRWFFDLLLQKRAVRIIDSAKISIHAH